MAEARIEHRTTLKKNDIKQRVSEVMGEVERRFDLKGRWDGDRYTFTRSGLDGLAVVEDGKVTVTITLGLLLSALRGRIESEIRARLGEKLP